MTPMHHPMAKYLRPGSELTTACPGCGDGMVAHSILRAIDEMQLEMDDFVFVCGIGCAGWIPSPYFDADTLHTTHGRPIAFATGVKLANPALRVMVVSGDGDLSAIGGNHLIHAARRDLDITVLCVNNGIYGMTGGQVAPTTPHDMRTVTTPYGNPERPFDLCKLVEGAGAGFVARWTTAHPRFITRTLTKALSHTGFAFIEVMSQCPVQYGRWSGLGGTVDLLEDLKDRSVTLRQSIRMDDEQMRDKWVVGEFPGAGGGDGTH